MKKLLLAFSLIFSYSVFSEEIPVPARVVKFNYPTLNGLPFAAIFAHDYQTDAEVGGVNLNFMSTNSARLVCLFLGYDRVYTYSLSKVDQDKATVLFMDQNLIATPVETLRIDGRIKAEYATTVFDQLSCYRNFR